MWTTLGRAWINKDLWLHNRESSSSKMIWIRLSNRRQSPPQRLQTSWNANEAKMFNQAQSCSNHIKNHKSNNYSNLIRANINKRLVEQEKRLRLTRYTPLHLLDIILFDLSRTQITITWILRRNSKLSKFQQLIGLVKYQAIKRDKRSPSIILYCQNKI